jgi:hypothetical protein
MDGKLATLAGAAALVAAPAIAGSEPTARGPAVPVAATYAELLTPIEGAPARLKLADAQDAAQYDAPARLIPAQYYNSYDNHHHHHHHNHYSRSWYLSHGYYWYGGRWMLRPRRNYHHHHHHHNDY